MLCADLRAKASQDRMKENLNPAATWQKQIHFDTEVDKSVGKIEIYSMRLEEYLTKAT